MKWGKKEGRFSYIDYGMTSMVGSIKSKKCTLLCICLEIVGLGRPKKASTYVKPPYDALFINLNVLSLNPFTLSLLRIY
jgi:hypothetical protein